MSPGPVPDHIHAGVEIAYQLRGQLPPECEALTEPDVDLQLAPPEAPGTVRRPDVVIVTREAGKRVRVERGAIKASEVLIAVEMSSPSSRRTATTPFPVELVLGALLWCLARERRGRNRPM